jgi:hypothetical protein
MVIREGRKGGGNVFACPEGIREAEIIQRSGVRAIAAITRRSAWRAMVAA